MGSNASERARTAEVAACLCLATDLGMGLPFEHGFKATGRAIRLADLLEVDTEIARQTYYVSLLTYSFCTTDVADAIKVFAGHMTDSFMPFVFGSRTEIARGIVAAFRASTVSRDAVSSRSPGLCQRRQVADYLEECANTFELPIRTGVRVERVTHDGSLFRLATSAGAMTAENVVVAMADYQVPNVPRFAEELGPGIVQLHSSEYRNRAQLRDGPVLIVGFGNSGAEIGVEVAGRHETYISGEHAALIPFRLENWFRQEHWRQAGQIRDRETPEHEHADRSQGQSPAWDRRAWVSAAGEGQAQGSPRSRSEAGASRHRGARWPA